MAEDPAAPPPTPSPPFLRPQDLYAPGMPSTGLPESEYGALDAMVRADLADEDARAAEAARAAARPPTVGREVPTITEEEARSRGWRPEAEGGPVAGSEYAPALELPGRTMRAPRRGVSGASRGPSVSGPPSASLGETFVDALTRRPAGDAPLFDEGHETPLDRALGRSADAVRNETRRTEIAAAGYADTAEELRGAEAARIDNENNRRAATADAMARYRS